MTRRPPIALLQEEAELLMRLSRAEQTSPGEVVRRLIVGEAARRGLLERTPEELEALEKREGAYHG